LTRCAAHEVGEIWVAVESVAQGYWGQPEQTQQTFHAYTSDTEEGHFSAQGIWVSCLKMKYLSLAASKI